MTKIVRVHAREILDSRGKPTVEAEVHLEDGTVGRASVPSGASTGTAEACELRDGDSARYDGMGVLGAVASVKEVIGRVIAGLDPADQTAIDERMIESDGTPTKSRLGANAILAVSLASARTAALARGVPLYGHLSDLAATTPKLPLPMTNMISGALHAGGNLDVQDVLVIPCGAADYPTQLEWIVRVYRRLGRLLWAGGFEGYLVGDEGGYAPKLGSNSAAIEFVVRAIEAAELRPGDDVTIALDVAATHIYKDGEYHFLTERGQRFTTQEFFAHFEAWAARFPISSIEDGLAESDWQGWRELTARLGDRLMLIGDDLFATNEKLLRRGIEEKVANAVLIKVNQIGTLTETLRTMRLARDHGYKCIVSARSGETEDDFLADLAVGTAADYIKIGGVARSERLAKYNRLLRIAEELE